MLSIIPLTLRVCRFIQYIYAVLLGAMEMSR